MATIQFAAATKGNRVAHITTDLGGTAYLMLYQGTQPASPDNTVSSGNALCALPCSATAAVKHFYVVGAAVKAGGSGGTNGTQTVTGTTGTGTKFQASVTVSGGAVTAVGSISVAGDYTVLPTSLDAEPVTGASLTGATLSLNMTAQIVFNTITTTNGSATGTVTFGRFAANNTAGGVGIVDLDVGTSGTSIIINNTSITSGVPVVATSATITEA
jgi:hypothetical protein